MRVAAVLALPMFSVGAWSTGPVLGAPKSIPSPCDSIECVPRGLPEGRAFISEDFNPDDAWLLTGRFSAHWESADGSASVDGPTDVDIDEALRWARSRAEIVFVRVDDEIYSAGRDQSGPTLPAWPPADFVPGPRPVGAPTAVPPEQAVPWVLRTVISCGPEFYTQRLAEVLRRNSRVEEIQGVSVTGNECKVNYVVRDESSVGAARTGSKAVEDALDEYRDQQGNSDGVRPRTTSVLGPA